MVGLEIGCENKRQPNFLFLTGERSESGGTHDGVN